jgi:1-deoxy-D-xylulose-5-phosphate reductoisomerase
VAVSGFLNNDVGFLTMSDVIEMCLQKIAFIKQPSLADYLNTDKETRILAQNLIQQMPLKALNI